ncbi:MAG: UvrD-helicase domain-containing protein, partial [Proteobacteria bacterium]|nr:UvrD-helicase domain-containing protein [Burkholderiales bacterium]
MSDAAATSERVRALQAHLIERALDPTRSVVVSACAGSGKTWLLVARVFRLLLDGAQPSEILAITFTRKAAQEMAQRLDRLLESAAVADDDALDRLLAERAIVPRDRAERARLHARARNLFERVLTSEPPLTIATFHSWFLQLIQRAPLAAGTLAGSMLTEENSTLLEEALQRFGARAARAGVAESATVTELVDSRLPPPGAAGERDGVAPVERVAGTHLAVAAGGVEGSLPAPVSMPSLATAIDRLFGECGLEPTLSLLRSFIAHRAEWWAVTRDHPEPLQSAVEQLRRALPLELRDDPMRDPLDAARSDRVFQRDLAAYRALLLRIGDGKHSRARAGAIERAQEAATSALWFKLISTGVCTESGSGPAFIYLPNKARQKRLGVEGERRFLEMHATLAARIDALSALDRERAAFTFNLAAFTCAVAVLREFDAVKRERQAIDFADLEQHACRLLTDDDHAAFLHARLDARYRHLLLDEFQDTNPLQWIALRAWLDAAQAAQATPTVFLVGDPKQSIYRFRGAEPRLFDAARTFLVEHYRADVLEQDTSRRCAQPVIDLVNALFDNDPVLTGFRAHHAFDLHKPGRVEILDLVARNAPPDAGCAAAGVPLDSPAGGAPQDNDEPPGTQGRSATGEEASSARPYRDPLTEARVEAEDLRVADEAAQLVEGLHRLRGQNVLDVHGLPRRVLWRDVLVLVRTRGKLSIYERALRDASIPCTSSRQGGLLLTLEVRDIVALLRFLVAPHDDLALAHALRSPVFSLSNEDLVAIATASDDIDPLDPVESVHDSGDGDAPRADRRHQEAPDTAVDVDGVMIERRPARPHRAQTWYRSLVRHAALPTASVEARRAAELIERWFVLAVSRPVHDLLDAIYFEADVLDRYAASVAPTAAPAIEANLLALLEHALAADAGRYPTLARFVDELGDLEHVPPQEALDEANPETLDDAVRIMTVHGAKGLEAPIVWLLNSAAPRLATRGYATLIDWPADAEAPTHFSFWTRKGNLGAEQQRVFERAQGLAEREDLNLLYVAVTRARQMLVVSGHRLQGSEASWYSRLRRAVVALAGRDEPGPIAHGAPLPRAVAAPALDP